MRGKIAAELRGYADPEKARALSSYFKTGKGQYGEGDVFIGVNVPDARRVARKFREAGLGDIKRLILSRIHEERLTGFLILVEKFRAGDAGRRRAIYQFYMENAERANNWDLVDLTAGRIAGEYLFDKDRSALYRFARSRNLWKRRIAIISTSAFIGRGDCSDTFRIAEMLLDDKHDLIHKAVGWMLREAGKRCGEGKEEEFLMRHRGKMPRTMLRYAIEKFDEGKKKRYMAR